MKAIVFQAIRRELFRAYYLALPRRLSKRRNQHRWPGSEASGGPISSAMLLPSLATLRTGSPIDVTRRAVILPSG
jgi:hypothetical protein